MAYAYTCTEIPLSDDSNINTSSHIIETEKELSYYAEDRKLPTIVGRNTSWVTYPTSWSFCVHVIVKIS